jgi:hypothetical protein
LSTAFDIRALMATPLDGHWLLATKDLGIGDRGANFGVTGGLSGLWRSEVAYDRQLDDLGRPVDGSISDVIFPSPQADGAGSSVVRTADVGWLEQPNIAALAAVVGLRSNCVQTGHFGRRGQSLKSLKSSVGGAGFEPATPASRTYAPSKYPEYIQLLRNTPDKSHNAVLNAISAPACKLRSNFKTPSSEAASSNASQMSCPRQAGCRPTTFLPEENCTPASNRQAAGEWR